MFYKTLLRNILQNVEENIRVGILFSNLVATVKIMGQSPYKAHVIATSEKPIFRLNENIPSRHLPAQS